MLAMPPQILDKQGRFQVWHTSIVGRASQILDKQW